MNEINDYIERTPEAALIRRFLHMICSDLEKSTKIDWVRRQVDVDSALHMVNGGLTAWGVTCDELAKLIKYNKWWYLKRRALAKYNEDQAKLKKETNDDV